MQTETGKLMTGAEVLLECLAREGVDCFFGYPGGVTLPFYDALYDSHIKHVLVRHEENACFAAEGYARATGKVGVCCATSGPGATNLVTGLVDAFSYLNLGHVFVANMTGNVVFLGFGLAGIGGIAIIASGASASARRAPMTSSTTIICWCSAATCRRSCRTPAGWSTSHATARARARRISSSIT